ncbi:MAG TPA: hypothetical protein VIA18_28345 [Polyangia bacterium]|nr:hypothetical protein [Polyangia bacterium]
MARWSWVAVVLFIGCGSHASPGRGGRSCGSCDGGTIAFTNVDDCHCCKPPGASCVTSAECCAGCVNGVCGCLAGVDHDLGTGEICGNPIACCSGTCDSAECL